LTVAFPFDHDEGKLSGLSGLQYCPNSVLPAVVVVSIVLAPVRLSHPGNFRQEYRAN
jgi:hypothetical protein